MFELESKIDKIQYYFSEIIKDYNFKITTIHSHRVQLKNNFVILELTTQRYYCDFTISIINQKDNRKYSAIELMNSLGLVSGVKVLTEEEIIEAGKITDELESNLYSFGRIIKKYFNFFLVGDFSAITKSP